MRAQTNLVKRGGVFYFRKKVPSDLRDHYGAESIRKSLRTFPLMPDAKREAGRLADLYEAEFATVRRSRSAPEVPLTERMIPELAKALEAHILTADDEARAEGYDEAAFALMADETKAELLSLRTAYARGDASPVSHALSDWLHHLGIAADPESPATLQLRRRFLEARLKALQGLAKRNEGEIVESPNGPTLGALRAAVIDQAPATASAQLRKSGPYLSDVVDYWKSTSEKAPRSITTVDTLLREFNELHGVLPVRQITKAHFVAMRDKLLTRVQPATVKARFNLLRAAFTVCIQDDQHGITENPLQYVKVRKVEDGEKARDAFSAEQLQTLFDADVHVKGSRPEGGKGETAFWAPLVALFTGARLDEILSLRADGVYEWEGVPVFHFRHRPHLGQHLKGKAKNNRRVPVHPELIRLGLLDYVEGLGDGPWLFPGIDRSAKKRSHSSAWGAWFGRYLKAVGIKTKTLTFHSFRHTFKHFARASGIEEDQHDAMTGHASPQVARRYGSAEGYPVDPLAKSVAHLKFGKLDLSRLAS